MAGHQAKFYINTEDSREIALRLRELSLLSTLKPCLQ